MLRIKTKPDGTSSTQNILVGDVMQHFKRENLTEQEKTTYKYLYKILAFATHTEIGETLVVYQALYNDFQVFVRPIDMFFSKVDTEKYPDIKQEYRFEKCVWSIAERNWIPEA